MPGPLPPVSTSPVAYYRLGDIAGSYAVHDSSGNSMTGSLLDGPDGMPVFGANSAFLYDTNSALDLSAGTNNPNTGFCTIDNTTEPPTVHNPLGSAFTQWTFECWFQYTSDTLPGLTGSVITIPNGDLMSGIASNGQRVSIQVGTVIGLENNDPTITPFISAEQAILFSPSWIQQEWVASHGFLGGAAIAPKSSPGLMWQVSTAGITGTTEPVWPTNIGSVVVDGSTTWVAVTNSSALFTGFPTNPLDGSWHHLVVVNNPEAIFDVYLDGNIARLNAYGGYGGNAVTNLTSIQVGTGINAFPGVMQDVAFYTVGLSQATAQGHYSTGFWLQQQEIGAAQGAASVGRTNKILAIGGLDPVNVLEVPYPWQTPLYSETDTVVTTSCLNYLQTSSQTEPGLIFQSPDGKIQAYSREYQYLSPLATTSQALLSDADDSPYYYDGPSLQIAGDDVDLWNDVQVESGIGSTATSAQIEIGQLQEWGPAQSALAAFSASVYGSRTLQGLTALQFAHDSDALAIAQWLLAIYALPIERVTQVSLNAQGNQGANLEQMLQRGLFDRITISYQGQTPGPGFLQDCLIEQITHDVTMEWPSWTTTYATSGYEILLDAFYLDSSTMDGPDVLVL